MRIIPSVLSLILILSWTGAFAGTLIESRDENGDLAKMRISETMARIDSGEPEDYMIVDLQASAVYVVSPAERIILLLDEGMMGMPARAGEAPPKVEVDGQGAGGKVAGYETRRYRVSVAGRHCFDDYVSAAVLDLPGMRRFAQVMAQASGEPVSRAEDPCAYAIEMMGQRYASLGVPLKTVEADGRVSHEILRIVTNVDFSADVFVLPPDYQRITQADLMRQAAQVMGGMSPHGPPGPDGRVDGMPDGAGMAPDMSQEEWDAMRRQLQEMQQEIQRLMKEPSPKGGQ